MTSMISAAEAMGVEVVGLVHPAVDLSEVLCAILRISQVGTLSSPSKRW